MKKIFFIPALFFVAALFSFTPAGEWQKYSSSEGHFNISFPGKPEESTQDDKAEDGTPFKIHFATFSPTDDEVYMATKVNTLETNLGTNPYIEFTFATDDFVGKDRIYLINKFQYSIITIFSTKTGLKSDADKFIKSFKPM